MNLKLLHKQHLRHTNFNSFDDLFELLNKPRKVNTTCIHRLHFVMILSKKVTSAHLKSQLSIHDCKERYSDRMTKTVSKNKAATLK